MPIEHLTEAEFDQADIKSMYMALDDVCKALKVDADDVRTREALAVRIIEFARRGERSPTGLRDRVLAEANGAA